MAANNRFITGNTIVQRTLHAIGLPVPNSASSATDTLSIQIWALLTELGQELLDAHEWSFKTKDHVFSTTAHPTYTDGLFDSFVTDLIYPLPDDFERYISITGWDRTSRLPLVGPMTAQEFAQLAARQMGPTTVGIHWMLRGGAIQFYSVPTGSSISLSYVSRGWVQDGANPTIFKDSMEDDADICLYDPRLIVAMLRFRWRQAKGFNTTDLEQQYIKALENAKNADSPGRDLYLSCPPPGFPYLGDVWGVGGIPGPPVGGPPHPPTPSPGPPSPTPPSPSPSPIPPGSIYAIDYFAEDYTP